MAAVLARRGGPLILLLALLAGPGCGAALAQNAGDLNGVFAQFEKLYKAGKYAEATEIGKRYLALSEKKFGPHHPEVASALNNLAVLYKEQGRYPEAEPLYHRSLAIREEALGRDHADVGLSLNNLAELYRVQGRFAEAEPLFIRSLAIREEALGPDHSDVGVTVNNLAGLYVQQRRYEEAEPLYKRSLAILEKALGPHHPLVGSTLNNLAELYRVQGRRYGEAEPLLNRSLAIREKALGLDHPDVSFALNNLALLYETQGRHGEAERLYKRSLTIREKALGPHHPLVGSTLNNLARLAMVQRQWEQAADYWRRSTNVIIHRTARGTTTVGEALSGKGKSEAERQSGRFLALVKVTHSLAGEEPSARINLAREMFQTAQWALASEAAQSLAQMAARGAKGDPALATLARERQDLVVEWQKADAGRTAAVSRPPSKRNPTDEAANIAHLSAIDKRLAEIDRRLAAEYPEYVSFSRPQPLLVEEVQAQLGPDEALVLMLDAPERPIPDETFVWVVTKRDVRWVRAELGTATLSREVAALRCGLDYEGAWRIAGSKCAQLLNITYSASDYRRGKPLPFDPDRAHVLYKALFGEVEDLIKGKHLLVVPSGPLTQLPFHVLVTAKPETLTPGLSDYRKIAWFARSNAITVLPAVSSLKALREYTKPSQATKPFLGIGNPLLDGPDESYSELKKTAMDRKSCGGLGPIRVAEIQRGRGVKPFAPRGGIADVADLRSASPLPETADELCDVAKAVGAAEADIFLGARASEREIKHLSEAGTLPIYRIVHFATHGALAGEISASAEPGLLLTPPQLGTEADDGYLSASEIASLKLDADWVILSACNTAGAEAKDAEALSGLARAFFYAGARALLVSHWYVDSNATVDLIKAAFAELQATPKLGRAEALRRSMLALIDGGNDARTHPTAWAPFVVVGEGGVGR